MCPQCTVVQESGFVPKPAEIVEWYDKIWLVVNCNIHGSQETLLTSNVPWFQKMWSATRTNIMEQSIEDIEDLKKRKRPKPQTMPIIVELPVYLNDVFLSTDEIDSQLKKIQLTFPAGTDYILKVSGKLSDDMAEMSKIVNYIHAKTDVYILVQVSFERLIILSKLEDSCFSKGRVFPSLKYYLKKGDEKQCLDEIGMTFQALKVFDDMKISVSILMEKPLADLSSLLAYLRMQIGFVKFIEMIVERSPSHIKSSMKTVNTSQIPEPMQASLRYERKNIYTDIIDPFELLKTIEEGTAKTISESDFFPVSMGNALSPFLSILGYGRFNINPSPFCGFGTILVTSNEHFSVPFTRFLDFPKLYQELLPLLPELKKGTEIPLTTLKKLKSIFSKCASPGVKVPNLISFITNPQKIEEAKKIVDKSQLLIVHNHMDITNLDLARRCQCAALLKNTDGPGFAACCNLYA
uniref:Uncharacterized protein n=1 Tax=Arcella intermedia TaxID=1963864 RepID=A0A6B2L384_9EUKA